MVVRIVTEDRHVIPVAQELRGPDHFRIGTAADGRAPGFGTPVEILNGRILYGDFAAREANPDSVRPVEAAPEVAVRVGAANVHPGPRLPVIKALEDVRSGCREDSRF